MCLPVKEGMNLSILDQTLCKLQLIDPSTTLEFTGRMLCQNVLVSGGVGSGKTSSIINPLLRDTIAYRAKDPVAKCGLFVFDSKTDGTTERVLKWANDYGRAEDVIILGPGSSHGYDPFGGVTEFEESELVAAKIQSGFVDDKENQYFFRTAHAGIDAVLTMQLLDTGSLELQSTLQFLFQVLVATRSSAPTDTSWDRLEKIQVALRQNRNAIDDHARRSFEMHLQNLMNWKSLDGKTRGILNSVVGNMLAPLTSHRIQPYFPSHGRTRVRIEEIVDSGKILILKINAAANADIASTLGRMIKADLYRSIQQRRFGPKANDRLVGLFLDEYPLVASGNEPFYGDVQNLQTMREKRGFVVAATQGYVSLVNAIGRSAWEGLRINLTNVIYLRSIEPEIERHASTVLGLREACGSVRVRVDAKDSTPGGMDVASSHERKFSVDSELPIVAPGMLARLDAHEGFYRLANGQQSEFPVFFAPCFEHVPFEAPAISVSMVQEAGRIIREVLHPEWGRNSEAQPAPSFTPLLESHDNPIPLPFMEWPLASLSIPYGVLRSFIFPHTPALIALFEQTRRCQGNHAAKDMPPPLYRSFYEFLEDAATQGETFSVADIQGLVPLFRRVRNSTKTFLSSLRKFRAGPWSSTEAIGVAAKRFYHQLGVQKSPAIFPEIPFTDSRFLDDLFPPHGRSMPEHCYGQRGEFFARFWHARQAALGLPDLTDAIWENEFVIPIFMERKSPVDPLLMATVILSFLWCFSPEP